MSIERRHEAGAWYRSVPHGVHAYRLDFVTLRRISPLTAVHNTSRRSDGLNPGELAKSLAHALSCRGVFRIAVCEHGRGLLSCTKLAACMQRTVTYAVNSLLETGRGAIPYAMLLFQLAVKLSRLALCG